MRHANTERDVFPIKRAMFKSAKWGECADDDREPLMLTPAYVLTAARFPVVFALACFGFAGDSGCPNLSLNRLDMEQ